MLASSREANRPETNDRKGRCAGIAHLTGGGGPEGKGGHRLRNESRKKALNFVALIHNAIGKRVESDADINKHCRK
jgi:hypothetical protein